MPLSLLAKIEEDEEKKRRAAQLRLENLSIRQWSQLGTPAPGMGEALNPAGASFQRAKEDDPSLRPSTFFESILRRVEEQRALQPAPAPLATPTPPAVPDTGGGFGDLLSGALDIGQAAISPIDQALEAIAPFAASSASQLFGGLAPGAPGAVGLPLQLLQAARNIPGIPTEPSGQEDIFDFLQQPFIPGADLIGRGTQATFESPLAAAQAEVEFGRSLTGPAGRFLGEGFVGTVPGLAQADIATGGRISDVAGAVGEAAFPEAAVLSNIVPLEAPLLGAARLAPRLAAQVPDIARLGLRQLDEFPTSPAGRFLGSEFGGGVPPTGPPSPDDFVPRFKPVGGDVPPARADVGAGGVERGAAEPPPGTDIVPRESRVPSVPVGESMVDDALLSPASAARLRQGEDDIHRFLASQASDGGTPPPPYSNPRLPGGPDTPEGGMHAVIAGTPGDRTELWAEYQGLQNLARRSTHERFNEWMDQVRKISRGQMPEFAAVPDAGLPATVSDITDVVDPGRFPGPRRGLDVTVRDVVPDVQRARQLARDILHVGGKGRRTPDTELLFLALHGEADVLDLPAAWRPMVRRLKTLIQREEDEMLAVFPWFKKSLVAEYYPRFWKSRPRPSRAVKNARNRVAREQFGADFENLSTEAQGKIIRDNPSLAGQEFKPTGGGAAPGTRPKFTRERQYDTFAEGLAEGEEPISWNPINQYVHRRLDGFRHRTSHALAEYLKASGRAVPQDAPHPNNWVVPDVPAFQRRPFEVDGKIRFGQPLVVSPQDNVMLKSLFPRYEPGFDPIEALRMFASAAKRAKVQGGLFQHVDLSLRGTAGAITLRDPTMLGVVPQAWFDAFRPGGRRAISQRILSDPDLRLIEAKGGEFGGGQSLRGVIKQGMPGSDEVLRFPVLGDIPAPKQLEGAQRLLNQAASYWSGALFEGVHTGIMAGFGRRIFKRMVRQGLSRDQAAFNTAQILNTFMSNIPDWQSVLNPRLRDFARGMFFSVNESEAWIRMSVQPIVGAKGTKLLSAGQLAALYIQAAAMAELINLGFTGELLDISQLNPYDPERRGFNTRFLRPRLAGDGVLGRIRSFRGPGPLNRDLYLDILGQADTPLRFLMSPIQGTKNRLSAPVSTVWGLLRGKTSFDDEDINLTTPGGLLRTVRELGEPIPATGFLGPERERIGAVGAGIQAGGFNVSVERIGEVREAIIERELKAGNFSNQYTRDGVPFTPGVRDLRDDDVAFLDRKYPGVFSDLSDEFRQETVESVTERQQGALLGVALDNAVEARDAQMEAIKTDAQAGTSSEQSFRKKLEDRIRNALQDYGTEVEVAFRNSGIEDRPIGELSDDDKLLRQSRELSEEHSSRFTFSGEEEDAAWTAYDAAFDDLFTARQQRRLEELRSEGDHPVEIARGELSASLSEYYHLPEGKARTNLRFRDADIDGALWALGRVSTLRRPSHQTEADAAWDRLYGGLSDDQGQDILQEAFGAFR